LESSAKSELVFGLVGPIGVDMIMVQTQLENALVGVGYKPISIRLTELMEQIAVEESAEDADDKYDSKIRSATTMRP